MAKRMSERMDEGKKEVAFSTLLGKTLIRVEVEDEQEVWFYCSDRTVFLLYHEQECCEEVWLEDVSGDLAGLIGFPLQMADEARSEEQERTWELGSATWTYYKLGHTKGGYATLCFRGESNGYYSERMKFCQIIKLEDVKYDMGDQ